MQFDFTNGLTAHDRVLMIDIDGPEQYLLTGYVLSGTIYVQADLSGWVAQNFSGQTGSVPDNTWPVWNGSAGTLNSGTSGSLNEEAVVLTPNSRIDRLVVAKETGSGWSTDITFVSQTQVLQPISLNVARAGTNAVLSWTNSAFVLQSSSLDVRGPYTNVPSGLSPYSTPMTGTNRFFRLVAY